MTFAIPTDPQKLTWLTNIAINAHCDVNADGRFTSGFGVWHRSTVSLLVSEGKHASGMRYSGQLLPLLAALSSMDQFGTCYEPVGGTFPVALSNKSGIIKSLHNFLAIPVNTPDSNALYALRNGLMHQSSLISIGTQKVPKHYWFEVDNSIAGLFQHASTAWDGVFSTRNNANKTIVNTQSIFKLALSLNEKLKNAHENGMLKIILSGGLEELLKSYVFIEFSDSLDKSYDRYLENLANKT